MSTVRFSTKLMTNVNTEMWGSNAPTFMDGGGRGVNRTEYYSIFKGTVPVTGEIGDWNSHDADLLIRWGLTTDSTTWRVVNSSVPQTTVQSPYAFAASTGNATWMWITSGKLFSGDPTDIRLGLILTVSAPGGGGEVIITNTHVKSGRLYRLQNIILSIPTNYTF